MEHSTQMILLDGRGFNLMVFDLPNSGEPYEMRMRNLANLALPNHVQIVDVNRCRGNEDIGKYLATIVARDPRCR